MAWQHTTLKGGLPKLSARGLVEVESREKRSLFEGWVVWGGCVEHFGGGRRFGAARCKTQRAETTRRSFLNEMPRAKGRGIVVFETGAVWHDVCP
jgi:hypothetical protein